MLATAGAVLTLDARLGKVCLEDASPMVYVVEIPVEEEGLTERMSQMRAWLDHQRCEPSRFRVSDAGAQAPGCRVYFGTETDAAAFAQKFGGRVLSTLASDAALI